ncbi:MFS transporter [Brevirhabdus sp.]|uniref:MFS transporter n=1 Tax=Brevirhabdus sp. TaxID=2004514 RepID=UPI004059249A
MVLPTGVQGKAAGDTTLRRRIWGWMMFDWASQPFYTLLLTFIFGPYFASVATQSFMAGGVGELAADARAQTIWSWAQMSAGLLIALSAPVLGAVADGTGRRKPWIVAFSLVYCIGTAALWWMLPDGSNLWFSLWMFGFAFVGAEFLLIFTNAYLPSLGRDDQIGRISGSGAALGYWGGVLSLFIMLLLFSENESGRTLLGIRPLFGLDPALREGTRFVGPFAALWYLAFMSFFFLWVHDDAPVIRAARAPRPSVGQVLRGLGRSLRGIAARRSLAAYLLSSMFYRDALNALYGFGGVYATLVLNWSIIMVGVFGIIGALTAAVATWIGGLLDARLGPKPVIVGTIVILMAVCAVIVSMSREMIFGIPLAPGSALPDIVFYICGAAIGGAGGALNASSRSMMVRHANPDRPTEAFGFYALSGKATAFLAPALIGLFTWLSENPRFGIAPLIVLFAIGLGLLLWVKPQGDRAAWADRRQI